MHQVIFKRGHAFTNINWPRLELLNVDFKLEPSAGGTRVSWIMEGPTNFMSKAMSVFMDMEKMVGDDFEKGLANLNDVARKRAEQEK